MGEFDTDRATGMAGAGAAAGTAIMPGVGTALGAGAGFLLGGLSGLLSPNRPKHKIDMPTLPMYAYGGQSMVDDMSPAAVQQRDAINDMYHRGDLSFSAQQKMLDELKVPVNNAGFIAAGYDRASGLQQARASDQYGYAQQIAGQGASIYQQAAQQGARGQALDARVGTSDQRGANLDWRGQAILDPRAGAMDQRGANLDWRSQQLDAEGVRLEGRAADAYGRASMQGPEAQLKLQPGWNQLAEQRQFGRGLAQQYASGTGPSAAQAQLQEGTDAAIASQMAMARSSGSPLSMYQAQNNAAQLQQRNANAAAQLRAQELQALRQDVMSQQDAAGSAARQLAETDYSSQRQNIDAQTARELSFMNASQGFTGAAQGQFNVANTGYGLADSANRSATDAYNAATANYGAATDARQEGTSAAAAAQNAYGQQLGFYDTAAQYGGLAGDIFRTSNDTTRTAQGYSGLAEGVRSAEHEAQMAADMARQAAVARSRDQQFQQYNLDRSRSDRYFGAAMQGLGSAAAGMSGGM